MASVINNQKDGAFQLDTHFYNEQLTYVIEEMGSQFEKIIKYFVVFQCFFSILGFIELFFFVSFFPFLVESSTVAFALAAMFLTVFGYFSLRLYLMSQQPAQFEEVRECYLRACYQLLGVSEALPEHYMTVAGALCKFSAALKGNEHSFYRPPKWLKVFESTLERLSNFFHGDDILKMRELLLQGSIDEHLKLIQAEPTSLEAHAALANAYVMLSELYRGDEVKFRNTSKKAIEELRILHDFAPKDTWVHIQLAYSYRDLQMPQEEMREYEEVLELSPNDTDSLFKLGQLYFKQGMNAKGLKVYEILKKMNSSKSEKLIENYGKH